MNNKTKHKIMEDNSIFHFQYRDEYYQISGNDPGTGKQNSNRTGHNYILPFIW